MASQKQVLKKATFSKKWQVGISLGMQLYRYHNYAKNSADLNFAVPATGSTLDYPNIDSIQVKNNYTYFGGLLFTKKLRSKRTFTFGLYFENKALLLRKTTKSLNTANQLSLVQTNEKVNIQAFEIPVYYGFILNPNAKNIVSFNMGIINQFNFVRNVKSSSISINQLKTYIPYLYVAPQLNLSLKQGNICLSPFVSYGFPRNNTRSKIEPMHLSSLGVQTIYYFKRK